MRFGLTADRSGNLRVNGQLVCVLAMERATPFMYVLRNDFGLWGPKFGCGLGQCGACTLHVNGKSMRVVWRRL
jgi:nicotinate dehydrogenase subunit A